jgi:HEPN domain-containing protein
MKDEIVKEWFERAKRDFEVSKSIFAQGKYYNEAIFLLHQALENI